MFVFHPVSINNIYSSFTLLHYVVVLNRVFFFFLSFFWYQITMQSQLVLNFLWNPGFSLTHDSLSLSSGALGLQTYVPPGPKFLRFLKYTYKFEIKLILHPLPQSVVLETKLKLRSQHMLGKYFMTWLHPHGSVLHLQALFHSSRRVPEENGTVAVEGKYLLFWDL